VARKGGDVKPRLAGLLACPICGADLRLVTSEQDPIREGEVITGELVCGPCSKGFPIRRGVPRLLLPTLSAVEEKTAAAFGWQWQEFVEMHDQYEAQFLDWIHPIKAEFFRDKMVMDAGCGIGRHAYYAARYGAREVIAMDLSDAVDTAYANTGSMPNVHVVQGDIHCPPFRRSASGGGFDFIYAIGVVHHLPDPKAGFKSLLRYLVPGGSIFVWVYGRENNGIVHHLIDPVRRTVTSRMRPSHLPLVAWPLTMVLQAVLKGVYRPLRGTRLFNALPLHDYLHSISAFEFRRNYNIVFDHLVAPVAHYLSQEEFTTWFRSSGLQDVQVSWRNQNSWRGFGWVAGSGLPASGSRGQASPRVK
jgi:SAM-dependent methyltransferase